MSNWSCVTQLLEKRKGPIDLGNYQPNGANHTHLLHLLSYYKFAAKMIGQGKRVLDIGCQEGLGSWILAKECGFCKGIDLDEMKIERARKNFPQEFMCEDFLESEHGHFDAIIHFDMKEQTDPKLSKFLRKCVSCLHEHGVAVIGMSSETIKENELKEHFEYVFPFFAHDEVIHAGYSSQANYVIALTCKPRK